MGKIKVANKVANGVEWVNRILNIDLIFWFLEIMSSYGNYGISTNMSFLKWKVHYNTACAENLEKRIQSQVKYHSIESGKSCGLHGLVGLVGSVGAWVRGCVGHVGRKLACVRWVAWVYKILAWVQHLTWVQN